VVLLAYVLYDDVFKERKFFKSHGVNKHAFLLKFFAFSASLGISLSFSICHYFLA
jgi:hypothetical protein